MEPLLGLMRERRRPDERLEIVILSGGKAGAKDRTKVSAFPAVNENL